MRPGGCLVHSRADLNRYLLARLHAFQCTRWWSEGKGTAVHAACEGAGRRTSRASALSSSRPTRLRSCVRTRWWCRRPHASAALTPTRSAPDQAATRPLLRDARLDLTDAQVAPHASRSRAFCHAMTQQESAQGWLLNPCLLLHCRAMLFPASHCWVSRKVGPSQQHQSHAQKNAPCARSDSTRNW